MPPLGTSSAAHGSATGTSRPILAAVTGSDCASRLPRKRRPYRRLYSHALVEPEKLEYAHISHYGRLASSLKSPECYALNIRSHAAACAPSTVS